MTERRPVVTVEQTLRDLDDMIRDCSIPSILHELYRERETLFEELNRTVNGVIALPVSGEDAL